MAETPTGNELFQARMKGKNRRCELMIFPGQKHGFFNARGNNEHYWKTLEAMETFLADLGLLKAP